MSELDPQLDEDEVALEAPTIADSPVARAAANTVQPTRASGTKRGTSSVQSATAQRALRAEELTRARGFGIVVTWICLIGIVSVPFIHTARWLQWLMGAALLFAGGTAFWAWMRVRSTRNPKRLMRIFGIASVSGACVVQVYGGVFSPAPIIISLGISYWALSDDRRFGTSIFFGAALIYLGCAIATTAGWVPDLGIFPAHETGIAARVITMFLLVAIFGLSFWQGRLSRDATHEAISRLDEALRMVQQREALLDEANQQIDVALDAAGGRRGPYTGVLAGPYRLGEVVGRGAMGEVYAAAHEKTGAAAAVKLLHGKALANPDLVQRFLRESQIATRLRAPNLVTVFEIGLVDDGAPFIAMERLEGKDLGWMLRRRRSLPLEDVVELAGQIALGLEVAHQAGIVHRDLKPPNIFRTDGEGTSATRWKILDFGVAKLRGHQGTLTHHALIGTPGYMSPEQAQGHDVDHRSDLFSLGSVLYRAITGRPPFSGPDTPQVLFDIVYRNPTRPSELVPSLPKDVDLVLALALAKHREDRFASALELAAAFRAAVRGELHPLLRARAAAQIRALPWGRTARPPA